MQDCLDESSALRQVSYGSGDGKFKHAYAANKGVCPIPCLSSNMANEGGRNDCQLITFITHTKRESNYFVVHQKCGMASSL